MINFDKNGNPQPEGIINIPFAEFKIIFLDNFGNSKTRKLIFTGYENYIIDFKKEINNQFDQWMSGSFTTTKENPNDIDLINLVEVKDELNQKQIKLREFLTVGGSKDKYLVDGYFIPIYSQNDPRFKITEYWLNHWAEFFGHDKLKRPKALIEVSFN
jgi:hypothetical protein